MSPYIPMWIIGGPFIALVILSFAFKGTSAMGGSAPRPGPRQVDTWDPAASLLDPMHPETKRRLV